MSAPEAVPARPQPPLPGASPAAAAGARASAARLAGAAAAAPTLAVLVGVLLVAFGVRMDDLAGQSFWWDEAYTALLAEGGLRAMLRELVTVDFHPPLHYLAVRAWLPLAGRSEFALRFISVAAGCLTVAVGARLGRRLYGERGGVVAGAVFALSPFLVYFSREARMYAPTALLATLALYLLHRALVSPPVAEGRWRLWAAYALVGALGLYTFYYFVFVLVFGGVWVVLTSAGAAAPARWRDRAALARWGAASAATAVLYAPWLPVLLGRAAVWDSAWASTSSPAKSVPWAWLDLTLGLPEVNLYRSPLHLAVLVALALLLPLGFARHVWPLRPWGTSRGGATGPAAGASGYLFALLGFLLPLALIAGVAMVKPVFHPRYAVPVAPALLLALTGAVSRRAPAGASSRWGAALGGGALVVLAAAAVLGLRQQATDPIFSRDDYRRAVGYIETRLQPGDVVLYNAPPGFRYYYRGAAPASYFPPPPYDEARVTEGLSSLLRGQRRLWYFVHMWNPTDPEGFVERQLEEHTRPLELAWFGLLRVSLHALPATPEFAAASLAPSRARFGGQLELVGYDLGAPELPAGGRVYLTLQWRVLRPGPDYGVWVGLADEQGRAWGREDRQPRNADLQLGSRWRPGEIVTTRHRLPAAVGAPPGTYRVEVGVYRLADLRGLDLLDELGRPAGQRFAPTSIRVVRPASWPETDPALPGQPRAQLAPAVELAASQLEPARTGAGGRLRLTLLWRALAAPAASPGAAAPGDYVAHLRLRGADGATLAQESGPAGESRYPSAGWSAGELVREQREVAVPPSAPPGRATLEIGLALVGAEPATWLALGSVEVDAVPRRFDEPAVPRRTDVDLGGQVRLLGYRLEPAALRPGGTLRLTLYWRALADGSRSYRVFTHLLDAESRIRAQKDGEPRDWTRPTTGWLKGEVVEDAYELEVERDAPPGEYELEVGLYEPQSGERLRVADAGGADLGDRVLLQRVELR